MIKLRRLPEPDCLKDIRAARLAGIRTLSRDPKSDEIDGYRIVSGDLWRGQHYKCCYCESKVGHSFNDVEHYRPKGRADRRPNVIATHGYWWLAFSWDNLLYACAACNRSGKNDQFPLTSTNVLVAEQQPPGDEEPLLIDPCGDKNPVEHIEHVFVSLNGNPAARHWHVRPRAGSMLGLWTIAVCKLDRHELLELRDDYVIHAVLPQTNALLRAIGENERAGTVREFERALVMLQPSNAHVGLAYDAFRHFVPSDILERQGLGWPQPSEVGT